MKALSKFNSKLGYLVAIACLAMMVVALGAAAKHSQFESPNQATHYLKQSVKMVACSHCMAIEVRNVATKTGLVTAAPISTRIKPVVLTIVVPVRSPLLI